MTQLHVGDIFKTGSVSFWRWFSHISWNSLGTSFCLTVTNKTWINIFSRWEYNSRITSWNDSMVKWNCWMARLVPLNFFGSCYYQIPIPKILCYHQCRKSIHSFWSLLKLKVKNHFWRCVKNIKCKWITSFISDHHKAVCMVSCSW